jgi:MFS family permease
MRGRYMGALMLAWNSASVLGPIAGALLYQCSPAALWLASGAIGCAGAVVIWRSGRVPAPRAEEAALAPV